MAFLPMKMWLQQQAIKRKKWLQPGSNELKLYPFKSIAEIRINKDSKHIPQNKKTQQHHSYWAYICIELFCCEWQQRNSTSTFNC